LSLCKVFDIITRKTFIESCIKFPNASIGLQEWYHALVKCDFKNFNELKISFPDARLVGDYRVVFNIMGKKYRLIVRIVFEFKAVQINWFGTHSEYDKTAVKTVHYKKK